MEYKDFKIKILPLTCLEKDPLNEEAYLDTDVSNLAESMKDIGFFGDLVAYPIEGENTGSNPGIVDMTQLCLQI